MANTDHPSPDRTNAGMPEPLFTVRQAADYLQCGDKFVRRRVYDGTLTHVKVGSCVRFRRSDLEAFVDKNTIAAA